jgi:hypothetical protein
VWVRQVSEEDFADGVVLLLADFAEDASVDPASVFFESLLDSAADSPPDFPLDE